MATTPAVVRLKIELSPQAAEALRELQVRLPAACPSATDGLEAITTNPNAIDQDRLRHNLTNHPPADPGVSGRMQGIRDWAKDFGTQILLDCPDSRERSLAITNLEQTVMWAIAAIARNQP